MRCSAARALALCAAVLSAGCASMQEAVAPAAQMRMMGDLRGGKLVLTCGAPCRSTWRAQLPAAVALDRSERWSELTLRVMRAGYGGDLAYFYLGRAAQGMGYFTAAAAYYGEARALAESSDESLHCARAARPDECGGVRIATDAPALAAESAAADRRLADRMAGPAPAPLRRAKTRTGAARLARNAGVRVAGPAQAIDSATLQVHGRVVALAGVVGRPDLYAAQLQALIDAHGAAVRCRRSGAGYVCTLPNGLDVARAAVANGIATVAADASNDLRVQQQAARAARRGVWKLALY